MGKLGDKFPYEDFVESTLKTYFELLGYDVEKGNPYRWEPDLICINPKTKKYWKIQAKGKTKAIGIDFNTCIGQIIKNMVDPKHKHAIALPDIKEYWDQAKKVPLWIRERLCLYFIWVDEEGNVQFIDPQEEI